MFHALMRYHSVIRCHSGGLYSGLKRFLLELGMTHRFLWRFGWYSSGMVSGWNICVLVSTSGEPRVESTGPSRFGARTASRGVSDVSSLFGPEYVEHLERTVVIRMFSTPTRQQACSLMSTSYLLARALARRRMGESECEVGNETQQA